MSGKPQVDRDASGRTVYRPDGEVLRSFVADESRVAIIRGPIGSGKSMGSMMRIWRHAMQQVRQRDGVRRSRWAIVRNTYPDLEQSTVKTWLDLFPEGLYGRFIRSKPMKHVIRAGDVELEAVFLALDTKDDVSKLRSTEWTGVYFNELQYIPKELFDEATTRTGRYPSVKDGGSHWYGVIADMNAPDEDHWLPMMTGEVPFPEHWSEEERALYRWPSEWAYYLQPPGLIEEMGPDGKTVVAYRPNPYAENLKWLAQSYTDQARGKTKPFIDSRLMNRITILVDGDPVWPQFRVETHVAKQELKPIAGHTVYVGLDFGRRPAAVFGQQVNVRWQVLFELQGFDMGAQRFAPMVKRAMETLFPHGTLFRVFGDPKGRDKTQTFETTAYEIFQTHGIRVEPAPVKGNDIRTRIEAVDFVLTQMLDGMPRFLVSPVCRSLKLAMAGKYHWKRAESGTEPAKDKWSDISDALQYMILGGGEGRSMIGRDVSSLPNPVIPRKLRGSGRRVA